MRFRLHTETNDVTLDFSGADVTGIGGLVVSDGCLYFDAPDDRPFAVTGAWDDSGNEIPLREIRGCRSKEELKVRLSLFGYDV